MDDDYRSRSVHHQRSLQSPIAFRPASATRPPRDLHPFPSAGEHLLRRGLDETGRQQPFEHLGRKAVRHHDCFELKPAALFINQLRHCLTPPSSPCLLFLTKHTRLIDEAVDATLKFPKSRRMIFHLRRPLFDSEEVLFTSFEGSAASRSVYALDEE
jgi:hypothetical protein